MNPLDGASRFSVTPVSYPLAVGGVDRAGRRLVVVPDTGGELAFVLGRLEEVLLALQPFEAEDAPAPADLGREALVAVEGLVMAVLEAERLPAVELVAPDGEFRLVPLRLVQLGEQQLVVAATALAAVGRALLPGGDAWVAEVLSDMRRDGEDVSELVASAARGHGLLDLAEDDDTRLLAGLLAGREGLLVLDVTAYGAYRRVTERALAVFHLNDPLARFVYRG